MARTLGDVLRSNASASARKGTSIRKKPNAGQPTTQPKTAAKRKRKSKPKPKTPSAASSAASSPERFNVSAAAASLLRKAGMGAKTVNPGSRPRNVKWALEYRRSPKSCGKGTHAVARRVYKCVDGPKPPRVRKTPNISPDRYTVGGVAAGANNQLYRVAQLKVWKPVRDVDKVEYAQDMFETLKDLTEEQYQSLIKRIKGNKKVDAIPEKVAAYRAQKTAAAASTTPKRTTRRNKYY